VSSSLIKSVLVKSNDLQDYLTDASFIRDGYADRVMLPDTIDEVAAALSEANRDRTPVTVSGAGTGTVGGRVAFGGIVLATDRLNRIKLVDLTNLTAVAEAGVILSDFQRSVESEGLFYPPDPTERGCFLGGTVATNASGARTFKYGPTRNYIAGLKVVLASGEVLDLKRGEVRADADGRLRVGSIELTLPTLRRPATRKNATGYFIAPEMDAIDLFIGSEGTLGVICEITARLLPKPEGLLSGVVFFANESDVLALVADVRAQGEARAIEFFDRESLNFLRQKYSTIPAEAVAAVFFEQETTAATEESVLEQWLTLLDRYHALAEDSWFATNTADQAKLREFRHQLPVLMNEWFAHYRQRKVSTDMSVPDEAFPGMLRLYQDTLRDSGLRYTIFGHIGDNHVHVNILPRDDAEGARARELYVQFLKHAAAVGGTLSAEHGVGKLKREYLPLFYSDDQLRALAAIKRALDPNGILGRGNIFSETLL
jgi:D-lactate dehydrogenase (cytochrome)